MTGKDLFLVSGKVVSVCLHNPQNVLSGEYLLVLIGDVVVGSISGYIE